LARGISGLFDKYKYRQLETEINKPVGQLVIKNFGGKPIELDREIEAYNSRKRGSQWGSGFYG